MSNATRSIPAVSTVKSIWPVLRAARRDPSSPTCSSVTSCGLIPSLVRAKRVANSDDPPKLLIAPLAPRSWAGVVMFFPTTKSKGNLLISPATAWRGTPRDRALMMSAAPSSAMGTSPAAIAATAFAPP